MKQIDKTNEEVLSIFSNMVNIMSIYMSKKKIIRK